jgi:ankyrin repeat protein
MVKCKVVYALVLVIFLYGLYGCKSKEESRKATKEKVLSGVKANNTSLNVSIHEETLNGQTDQVISILDRGVGIDTLDAEGRTPLMYASFNGHYELMKRLIEKGANVNLQDSYGRTALMMASSGPYAKAVNLLLDSYADPNISDTEEHFTALMYAASGGQLEVVRLLIANKADPFLKDIDGDNAFTFAKNNGHAEVAAHLQSLIK